MDAFVDSDVVISSLLSRSGAAYALMQQDGVNLYISNHSFSELKIVVERLSIDEGLLNEMVESRLTVVNDERSIDQCREKFKHYVGDVNDSHIVSGAVAGNVRFLVTYNLKHFMKDKIRDEFDIVVMTPGLFLQYLRSN